MEMTKSQKIAMIKFHEKAAKAYKKYGKNDHVKAAKRMILKIKASN